MNKYGAIRVKCDGITFHSKREAARYRELLLLVKAKQIKDLVLQPKFPIEINGQHVCNVIGDFEYIEGKIWVVEDVKGFDTAISKLKRKMVKAFYQTVDWRVVK
jgi:uncharacterized protein DUF1064